MADPEYSETGGPPPESEPPRRAGADVWVRRIVVALVVVVVAWIGFEMLSAYLPRTWAQRVGRQVDGSMSQGIFWGLFYGFVFTLAAALVASLAALRRVAWPWKPVIVLVGLALALPNWLTLWVVIGNSSAAHAGERIFDVDAPGFRGATLVGVVLALLVAAWLAWILTLSRRRKRQVRDLRSQLQQDAPPDEEREEPPHA